MRAQDAPLTNAAAIKQMGSAAAEQQRKPVCLRAFHLGTSPGASLSNLQQEGIPIVAVFRNASELPPPNSEVEIMGITRGSKQKQQADEPWIEVESVRVLARDVTAQPIMTPLELVAACRFPLQWVEIDGYVLQVRRVHEVLQVILCGAKGWVFCSISDAGSSQTIPLEWMNARLRVQGMNLSHADANGSTLITYGLMNATILETGYTDAFDAPLGNAKSMLTAALTGKRSKLTAHVVYFDTTGWVWLRDADGTAFIARYMFPWKSDPNAPQLTAATPARPKIAEGDLVEIVGSPLAEPHGLWLRECEVRVLDHGPPREPDPITEAGSQLALHRNQLVSFRGRFVSQSSTRPPLRHFFESVRLSCEGNEVEVFMDTVDGGHLPTFTPGDLLHASGIAVTESPDSPTRLLLRRATDLRSLGADPEVLLSKQRHNFAIVLACALMGLGVIIYLRRGLLRARAQAQQISLLNAELENRVASRTHDLEAARRALAEALKEEQDVGQLKSRFVTSVSHEFRTPLGVIMSATDLLTGYRERMQPEQVNEHLQEIRYATRQMSNMMEDILLLGRAEAGRVDIHPLSVDLLELCQRLADETRSGAAQTGQTLITYDPLPGPALLDEVLFRHIFSNILHNAVKYSAAGACIKVHIQVEGPLAFISIADEGIGIPAADQSKLFEPFSRATNVSHLPGTGLGLVVVKRCAELHGGSVTFTSIPGKGTTFIIRLPVWE